jgi:Lrp/AsnC family leucine-responsive transcriptional regulator
MIDEIDRKILDLLQDDARLTNADLGKAVGINASSVFERVKKLERRGVIKRYIAVVDPESLGKPLTAFIRLTVESSRDQSFETTYSRIQNAFLAESDIVECHSVAGEESLIIKVRVGGPKRLEALIARIRDITGSPHSVTNVVLSTYKESTHVEPAAE